jgi:hypothetical protein
MRERVHSRQDVTVKEGEQLALNHCCYTIADVEKPVMVRDARPPLYRSSTVLMPIASTQGPVLVCTVKDSDAAKTGGVKDENSSFNDAR